MREIIVVCLSEKQSRDRVARVLDRYFWRIGDRTWRGKATNACLDRVARELRKKATRNTAVVLHEIRSASESRKPLIRIGSRAAFSDEGVVPVASHPADFRRVAALMTAGQSGAAAVGIAALFHDLGKATNLFQAKLRRALNGAPPEADAIRHELFSAAVWDQLFGDTDDASLAAVLHDLTPGQIDAACLRAGAHLHRLHAQPAHTLTLRFVLREGTLSHLIGMLILTHHRLPSADSDHATLGRDRHTRPDSPLNPGVDLAIAPGIPFWHEVWWRAALRAEAGHLRPDAHPASADIALRACLMFADHLGSAKKVAQQVIADHLANTTRLAGETRFVPADSLSRHVKRVYRYARPSCEMTLDLRDSFPALAEAALPVDILHPPVSADARFAWQAEAARAARSICESREGGFFAAILAGTGTGKTRGAPTILAHAAMADARPGRRYLRFCLCLGLRVLATQSAREYVADLGFRGEDVAVLIGDPPLAFHDGTEQGTAQQGSESLLNVPEWLQVAQAGGAIPDPGTAAEENWLRGLSLDTDRGLPAFLDQVLETAGTRAGHGRRLLQTPVIVGTIDHLMGVAAPVNSRFLLQSLRVMTSDLILDEIDQYDGEDLAAIGRLIFQAGAAGRRVIIMSATLTPDIAQALHLAYAKGWADHAGACGMASHVNIMLCGGTAGSVFTNPADEAMPDLLDRCRAAVIAGIRAAPPARRGEILAPCAHWTDLVGQVDQGCSRLHDLNAVEIAGFRVSVGMVRMTRIAHTAALAVQMRSGDLGGRLRVMVCLHARMPRLHRSYIETRLRQALTRKGDAPEAGVQALCAAAGLFGRAQLIGARDIEIVVVTSPVIETGNDLDFDYAILDPVSTRSIIQAAGRVRRHRPACGNHPNVLILGRSPVAMQGGHLSKPGVETPPASATGVPVTAELRQFAGRHFADLAGAADFSIISAEQILSDTIAFPLRDAEALLRGRMISTAQHDPLGRYLHRAICRWNLTMTRTRRFRRSETREILFRLVGDSWDRAEWFVDQNPGTRDSNLVSAGHLHTTETPPGVWRLFTELTQNAWAGLSTGTGDMTTADVRDFSRVSVPMYGDDLHTEMTYTEFTGFTRGTPEDLSGAFGKMF